MSTTPNRPSPSNWLKWFDPRQREIGTWAFILNRITALGLTLYLFLHLIILSQLAGGEAAYQGFLDLIHSPIFVFGEWLVIIAGLIHGLNGLRIGLTSFGIAIPYQKQFFYILMVIAVAGGLYFFVSMFAA
jgi:succinate dehydrogenase / fumarate reductase cytochrome b subunit